VYVYSLTVSFLLPSLSLSLSFAFTNIVIFLSLLSPVLLLSQIFGRFFFLDRVSILFPLVVRQALFVYVCARVIVLDKVVCVALCISVFGLLVVGAMGGCAYNGPQDQKLKCQKKSSGTVSHSRLRLESIPTRWWRKLRFVT